MNTDIFVYFPSLHPAMAPHGLPGEVFFLSPVQAGNEGGPFVQHTAKPWPLSPKEAASRLATMMEQGGAMANKCGRLAGHWKATPTGCQGEASLADIKKSEDIARVLREGSDAVLRHATQVQEETLLLNAQLALLLAWHLEECVMDIRALERELTQQEVRLNQILAEDVKLKRLEDHGVASLVRETGDWRKLVAAQAPFLPEGAALVTADPDVVSEIADCETFAPCEDGHFLLKTAPAGTRLLHARMSLAALTAARGVSAKAGNVRACMRQERDIYIIQQPCCPASGFNAEHQK